MQAPSTYTRNSTYYFRLFNYVWWTLTAATSVSWVTKLVENILFGLTRWTSDSNIHSTHTHLCSVPSFLTGADQQWLVPPSVCPACDSSPPATLPACLPGACLASWSSCCSAGSPTCFSLPPAETRKCYKLHKQFRPHGLELHTCLFLSMFSQRNQLKKKKAAMLVSCQRHQRCKHTHKTEEVCSSLILFCFRTCQHQCPLV